MVGVNLGLVYRVVGVNRGWVYVVVGANRGQNEDYGKALSSACKTQATHGDAHTERRRRRRRRSDDEDNYVRGEGSS